MSKKYKLPERYELEISDYHSLKYSCGKFRIKDLQRNVKSRSFYQKHLSKLEKIISDYEDNLQKLQDLTNIHDNSNIDVILKPGSSYNLFYKTVDVGLFSTIPELLSVISRIENYEFQIQALNNREEISL